MEHTSANVLLNLNLLWFFCYWKSTCPFVFFFSGHLSPPKTRHPTNLNESVYMEKPVWQGDTSSDPKLSQHHPSPFGLWFQMGWNNSSQIGSVRQVGVKIDKKKLKRPTHLHFLFQKCQQPSFQCQLLSLKFRKFWPWRWLSPPAGHRWIAPCKAQKGEEAGRSCSKLWSLLPCFAMWFCCPLGIMLPSYMGIWINQYKDPSC